MIVAGFGFREGATGASLQNAYARAASGESVRLIATVEDKASSAAFRAFADEVGLPAVAIAPADLEAQETATCSAASQSARGVGSVAEAAALAAAGPGAELIAPRIISEDGMATCALAIGERK